MPRIRVLIGALIVALALMGLTASARAQDMEETFQISGGLGFSTNGFAVGAAGDYFFRDQLSGQARIDILGDVWGITGGAQWWFFDEDRGFTPYAGAAVGFYGTKDATAFGLNGGGGIDWELKENLFLGPAARIHVAFAEGESVTEFAALAVISYRF